MPIDSTADLLFRIGADSGDAESNIAAFRTLLSKDLGDISTEFGDWSTKVFGDLSTVKGAMLATGAGLAAAVVAVGAACVEAAGHYAEYVSEVDRGSRATGISVEQMSGLKFMASETGTSYDSLVSGLTRFTSTIVKAAEGGKQQEEMFARLGISQDQVKAGEKDMMPLLELVADRFHSMESTVEKTAMARELFSRGGAALVRMLNQGGEAIKEFNKEAAAMGLIITTQDVVAVNEYKAALAAMKAEHEALDIEIGKNTLPIMKHLEIGFVSLLQSMGHLGQADFVAQWATNFSIAETKVQSLAQALSKLNTGDKGLEPPDPAPVKEAKDEWAGLADVLQRVREATIDTASVDERTTKEYERLTDALDKATKKYEELKAAGKLTAEDAKAQAVALSAMPAALSALLTRYIEEIGQKNREAGEQLREETLRQGEQTLATRVALLDLERQKRLEKMGEKRTDDANNLALEAALYKVGLDKIANEAAEAVQHQGDELDRMLAAQSARTLTQKHADLDRELDARAAAMAKAEDFEAAHWEKLDAIAKAGHAKIDADAKAAGDTEIARLGEQLSKIERAHETSAERIANEYQADMVKYVAAEERKTLAAATGEAQRAQIAAMFASIRKGLTDKEGADLQQLQNSTGWQGVFGSKFGEMIRGNDALLKEWQSSTNQSVMMVRVTLEGLKETGQKTFESLAQGMGGNIAHALVYKTSIKEAMEAALKSTLENLAGQAFVYAIFSTALGFTDLAMGNMSGAAAAFEAAGIWGSVGGAAAVAGRAVAGGSGGAAGGAGTGPGGAGVGQFGSQTAARQGDQQGVPAPAAAGGPHITVNVQGHLVGWSNIGQLTDALSDAVLNSGHTLTATNTTTGRQIQQ